MFFHNLMSILIMDLLFLCPSTMMELGFKNPPSVLTCLEKMEESNSISFHVFVQPVDIEY